MNTNTEELKKLAEAATPGPWVAGGPSFGTPMPVWCDEVVTESGGDSPESVCLCPSGAEETSTADMSYIAAANPAAILALIQQRDELLAAHAEMAKQVVDLRHELRRYQEREATMGWNQA